MDQGAGANRAAPIFWFVRKRLAAIRGHGMRHVFGYGATRASARFRVRSSV